MAALHLSILVVTIFALLSFGNAFNIGMKLLVVTTDGSQPSYTALINALNARGIPYDVHRTLYRGSFTGHPLTLVAGGVPKYYGIVFSHNMGYDTGGSNFAYGISDSMLAKLRAYEEQYNVPEVILYSVPLDSKFPSGTSLTTATLEGNSNTFTFSWDQTHANFFLPGIVSTTNLTVTDIFHYPAKIDDPSTTPTVPIVWITETGQSAVPGAVLTTFNPGTSRQHQRMSFFFDHNPNSVVSNLVAHVWVEFVTHGIYLGKRRVYLDVQVDDLFADANIWNDVAKSEEVGDKARNTGEDYLQMCKWHRGYPTKSMPAKSGLDIHIWFNGAGGYGDAAFNVPDFDGGALVNAMKPLVPYYWFGTHTWSHPYLDALSQADVDIQLDKNLAFGNSNFSFDTTNSAYYLAHTMVTPSISGLFNDNAIRSLINHGMTSTAGDTSRAELTNPNPYHGYYTFWAGSADLRTLFVIPRAPTQIYYNCWNDVQEVSEFNYLYQSYYGRAFTFDEILAHEADICLALFAAYDPRSYMFHVANMILFDYQTTSNTTLLRLWIEAVNDRFREYFTLPFVSIKQDALADVYLNREAYDKCSFSATMSVVSGKVSSVTVDPAGCSVDVPLTLPKRAAVTPSVSGTTIESYGPDATVIVKSGSTVNTVTFTQPFPWIY